MRSRNLRRRPAFILSVLVLLSAAAVVVVSNGRPAAEKFAFPTGFDNEVVKVTCSPRAPHTSLQEQAELSFQIFEDKLALLSEVSAREMQKAIENGNSDELRAVERQRQQFLLNLLSNINREFGCVVDLAM